MIISVSSGVAASLTSLGQFQTDLQQHIDDSDKLINSFQDIQKYTCSLSGGVGSLDAAMDEIDTRVMAEEERRFNARTTLNDTNDFCDLAMRIDDQVAGDVRQNKEEFYCMNPWARPPESEDEGGFWGWVGEKLEQAGGAIASAWEWMKDTAVKAWEGLKTFYEEHTAEFWAIVGTTLLSIVAMALCPFTGGASLILYTAAVSAISAGIVSTVRSAETQYKEKGCIDWGEALLEGGKGAAVGFVTGAAGGALGQWIAGSLYSSGSVLMNSSNFGTRMLAAFGIGAASESLTGMGTRAIESTLEQYIETGDVDWNTVKDDALDPSKILLDVVVGGSTQASVEYHQYKADMAVRNYNDKMDPVGHAADKGIKLKRSKNGTLDYEGTDHIIKNSDDQEIIVKIKAQGTRSKDFKEARKQAIGKYGLDPKELDIDVTWQHMDDYNVRTNEITLQLVDRDAHMGIRHSGGGKQYDVAHGTTGYK